jgi:hypothetical protein
MVRWEYLTIDHAYLPARTGEVDLLNDAGGQGWELITIMSNHVAYMRRPINDRSRARAKTPLAPKKLTLPARPPTCRVSGNCHTRWSMPSAALRALSMVDYVNVRRMSPSASTTRTRKPLIASLRISTCIDRTRGPAGVPPVFMQPGLRIE